MKKILLFCALVSSVLLVSCDKVKGPYNEIAVATDDTSTTEVRKRKILIEDFTGHRCPNCPRAAEALKSIQQFFPGRIIGMGVHVTNQFAAPASGIYFIDFRTPVGNSNDSLFGVSALGLPTGMVNRLRVNGIRRIEYTKWSEYADSLLDLPPAAYITIENAYNSSTRTVTSTVKTDFLTDTLSGTYKLAVYIIEDSIPHAQKDNLLPAPGNDSNYVHQHVLRGSVNGTFGELLNTTPVNSTSTFTKVYTKVLPATWRDKKCSIVAFIYNDSNKEVLQAEEHGVIE